MPIMAFLICLGLAAAVVSTVFLKSIPTSSILAGEKKVLLSAAASVGLVFVLFLIAMYAGGMSRQKEWRPLRACAGYMMFTTLFTFVAVVALAIGYFRFSRPDRIMAYIMLGLMSLVTIEMLLNIVLDFYRPRVEGVEARAVYDSRLLGLLSARRPPQNRLGDAGLSIRLPCFADMVLSFYRTVHRASCPLPASHFVPLELLCHCRP